jgi:hypothetical protein
MGNNLNSFQPMREFQSQDKPLEEKRITLDINEDEIFSKILDISNTLLFEYNNEFLKEDFCSKLAIIYSKKLSKFNIKVLKSLYNSINSKNVDEDFIVGIQYLPNNEDKFTDFMDIFKDGLKESFWNKKIELDPEKLSLTDDNLQKNNITSYLKKNQTQYYINPKHVNNLLNTKTVDPIAKIGGFVNSNTHLIKKFNTETEKNNRNKDRNRIINSKEKVLSNTNSNFLLNKKTDIRSNSQNRMEPNSQPRKEGNSQNNTQPRRESSNLNRMEPNSQPKRESTNLNRMETNTQPRRESNNLNRMETNTQPRRESTNLNRMEINTQPRREPRNQNRMENNISQNQSSNFKHVSIKKINETTNNIILKSYNFKGDSEIAVNDLIKYYCPKDFTPKSFCDNNEKCQLTKKE